MSIYPAVKRASLKLAEVVVSLGLALIISAVILAIEEPRIRTAMDGSVMLPGYFTAFLNSAGTALAYVSAHLASLGGWYLTVSGVLLSACELLAAQKNTNVRRLIKVRSQRAIRVLFAVIPLAAMVWLLLVILFLPPRGIGRYFAVRFREDHPNATWYEGIQAGLRFDWLHVSHLVSIGAIILGVATFAFAAWSFGFWGFLALLVSISRRAAKLLRLKAYTPIASILISMAGIVIASLA